MDLLLKKVIGICIKKHRWQVYLIVDRETIRTILKALDLEKVLRTAHKHIYCSIDGFSRRILWLKVGSTNSNPKVIALYFRIIKIHICYS